MRTGMNVGELREMIKDLPDDTELVKFLKEIPHEEDELYWYSTQPVYKIRLKRVNDEGKVPRRPRKEVSGCTKQVLVWMF